MEFLEYNPHTMDSKESLLETLANMKGEKGITYELYEKLPWKDVDSSHIERVAYDRKNQKLYIQFKNRINSQGQEDIVVYQYSNVNANQYNAFMNAESKGSFFHQNFRNKSPYLRLWVGERPETYKKKHIYIRKKI